MHLNFHKILIINHLTSNKIIKNFNKKINERGENSRVMKNELRLQDAALLKIIIGTVWMFFTNQNKKIRNQLNFNILLNFIFAEMVKEIQKKVEKMEIVFKMEAVENIQIAYSPLIIWNLFGLELSIIWDIISFSNDEKISWTSRRAYFVLSFFLESWRLSG